MTAAAPQWISVADRLPDMGVDVLVVSRDGFVRLACYDTAGGWVDETDADESPTHWMPLPESPR